MIEPEIRDQAYLFFIEEARELLQTIESGLLTLRSDPSTNNIHEIMRAAHSIKGGAASIKLDTIKTLAHRLEAIFKALYKEEIDTELESLLLSSYDCLRNPLMEQIERGSFDEEAALANAQPILSQIEARLATAMKATEDYIPSTSDLGVDLVENIFEVDVGQELENLVNVIEDPGTHEVAGELRATAEVLAGFAELLNLPGLGNLATTAEQAVNLHPECALEITQLALEDFRAAREKVLAGDRVEGGSPSAALLAFISEEVHEQENPSLDDVFGDFAEESSEESEALGGIETENPSLDDVFGDFAEESSEELGALGETEEIEAETPASIEEAVDSIGKIFEELPSLSPADLSPTLQPEEPVSTNTSQKAVQSPKSQALSTPGAANLSLRVDVSRLEKMNNLVGELTINRNSLALQNKQLQDTVRELLRRFGKFQKIAGSLRQLSDQMLGSTEGISQRLPENRPNSETDQDNFDELEMDSYSQVHSVLQEMFEESLQLEEAVDDVTLFAQQSNGTIEEQRQMLDFLREEVMWARMLPMSEVLNRFPRVLRDLCANYGKNVSLKMTQTAVLVDKAVLEKLYDPLLHLLRNAFDHGMELPEERVRQGKSAEGTIQINSYHLGNQTIIEIRDDGRGIDLDKIGQLAVEKGILSATELDLTSTEQLLDLIFEPGFSTSSTVSEISGRGVGLDVVRSQLKEIKGTVSVNSVQGKRTTFTLHLPLTLTISKLLVCSIGSTAVALPSESIEEIIIPNEEQIKHSGKQRFLFWQDQVIPIYPLVDLLEYSCPIPSTVPSKVLVTSVNAPLDWASPLLLLRFSEQFFALEIERLVMEQELVIKPMSGAITPPSYIYGCTILGDGTLIPTIDGTLLISEVMNPSQPQPAGRKTTMGERADTPPPRQAIHGKRVLVVDDSAALRRTLANSLEKAGYLVLQGRDGKEALTQLGKNDVELVICDLEMPNMNGFEFLTQRRTQSKLAQIPVAMLTSRSNPKHRQLAMRLGANAYFTKPYIEQNFLSQLEGIISKGVASSVNS